MKLQFKHQPYQQEAVDAVVDCFAGQPFIGNVGYNVAPGRAEQSRGVEMWEKGVANARLVIPDAQILANIQAVQKKRGLFISKEIHDGKIKEYQPSPYNLDIEMETGVGKTFCYIKTMFEMNKRFGWSKFVVVVPSIAIREGVKHSFGVMEDYFFELYEKKAEAFIYNASEPTRIGQFCEKPNIQVMIINSQAFNAKSNAQRRIYAELDSFQSRRPIDMIKATNPIMIIDEPQKVEGDEKNPSKTFQTLSEFNPMMILRYSATHRKTHDKIHRLDAVDAYTQKLVKKIEVRGIDTRGIGGGNAYMYLDSVDLNHYPARARIDIEVKGKSGPNRRLVWVKKGTKLDAKTASGGLPQYKDFVVTDIRADEGRERVVFKNGVELAPGTAYGDVNEDDIRRIQIREAIKAHFDREALNFGQKIKTLTLFFIDQVKKYRDYDREHAKGDYARWFEEAYREELKERLAELPFDSEYVAYLKGHAAEALHDGYFSIDKNNRSIDGKIKSGYSEDEKAYDYILKEKETLLSFETPARFIFSHSALREGWDNPNVFVICMLKQSDNTTSRRQEVGRGLRICVNDQGVRQDDAVTVHETNVLTVVTSDSYTKFVTELQHEIADTLSARPGVLDASSLEGRWLKGDDETGSAQINDETARLIYRWLVKNDFTDDQDKLLPTFHLAVASNALPALPAELAPYESSLVHLIEMVDKRKIEYEDNRGNQTNPVNEKNFKKKEFKGLWDRINRKSVYTVSFDSGELVPKAVAALESELQTTGSTYTVSTGKQNSDTSYEEMTQGSAFSNPKTSESRELKSAASSVRYDLLAEIADAAELTRKTVAEILSKINPSCFEHFKRNPEQFIARASEIIKSQKAAVVIEGITYDLLDKTYSTEIFTKERIPKKDAKKREKHVLDFVRVDSDVERDLANELESREEVVVYAKLPGGFKIPTPVGNYNPDWAIAFKEGSVKYIYFIAETKGTLDSLSLRNIEVAKIKCAKKFFAKINAAKGGGNVRYDVIKTYDDLLAKMQG